MKTTYAPERLSQLFGSFETIAEKDGYAIIRTEDGRYHNVLSADYGNGNRCHTAAKGNGYPGLNEALSALARIQFETAVALGLRWPPPHMYQRNGVPGRMVRSIYPSQWTGSYGSYLFEPATLVGAKADPRRLRRITRKLPTAPADTSW